jgi:hypothetical protein
VTLLELNVNLNRVASALERIGDILERRYPKPVHNLDKPHTEKDLIILNDEKLWQQEQEDIYQRAKELGLPVDSLR